LIIRDEANAIAGQGQWKIPEWLQQGECRGGAAEAEWSYVIVGLDVTAIKDN